MFKILNKTFADKGFYINLNSSTDRKENIDRLINKYQIEGIERFEALTDEMIQYSCTKSHLGVFKKALDEDLDIIFVSEDDMNIEDECYLPYSDEKVLFKDIISKVNEDLKNVEWDVLLFGCNPKTHLIPITDTLATNHRSTGAWAYIIKKRAYKFILENLNYKKDLLAIDDYLPLLNNFGFTTLTTIPLTINHSIGFISTLQPLGPVNYDTWIKGNYHKFLYDNYKNNFSQTTVEKEVTIVIAGHFVKDYLYYLNYLIHSLPDNLTKCKFLIHYDESSDFDTNLEKYKLTTYFRDIRSHINVTLSYGFGGLISTIETVLDKIKTPYFIFLEHDWVFLEKNNIEFVNLVESFNNHDFINAVWFAKDDNIMRGFEISQDIDGITTPFERESRVSEVNLVTTCRWSNNPAMFRVSKMKTWFNDIIKNEHVGKIHQSQHNVEGTMIPYYRQIISENKWVDIRDNWGTFLYGDLNEGPYVGHTDASRRYQGISKSMPEINGENYIKNNPL
jgi:GR25 family glycosyltransferase involved in LPS biosynthesis